MKEIIYARTLNPENFDYRVYDISEDNYNEVLIDGGRNFSSIDYENYLEMIKKVISGYNSWDFDYYYKGSIMDFLKDNLPRKENKKNLTPMEAHNIKMSIECWVAGKLDEADVICECLSVITGQIYKHTGLRGSCQGDYVEAYYPVKGGIRDYLDYVEAWYFGTGTEVEIHDDDGTEPKSAEDICGYTFYTAKWRVEDIKQEIKKYCGYHEDEDVEVKLWLYKRTETYHVDKYEEAD